LKNFFEKLRKINLIGLLLIFIGLLIFVIGDIFLVIYNKSTSFYAYILYVLSAFMLTLFILVLVYNFPKIRDKIILILRKNKYTDNFLNSYGYRSIVLVFCSFAFNILYAIFQVVIAIMTKSIWYGALAVYYIVLTCIRGGLIFRSISSKKEKDSVKLQRQIKAYRNCGLYLVILNLALISAVVQMIIDSRGFAYAGLMIYAVATYTFYKLIMSIVNIFKARKHNDYLIQIMKNVSFADALVSILALQTAMFQAFGSGVNPDLFNSITGSVVLTIIMGMGLFMLIKGNKLLKSQNVM